MCLYIVTIIVAGIYGYVDFYMYEGHDVLWSVFNYNYFFDFLK
jgi:hypothetical protein